MPYYVRPEGNLTCDCPSCWPKGYAHLFSDRLAANDYLKLQSNRADLSVVFKPSKIELDMWFSREADRFRRAEYLPVPWREAESKYDKLHFAHLSLDIPGMVAFTVDDEHGVQDRQTRMTAGRYLTRYYPELGATAIARLVAKVKATCAPCFTLLTTPADIVRAYKNGPSSCMSHDFDNLDCHPCSVYGLPGDLALAIVGDTAELSQRAIVWPEKKVYTRIYGTGPLEHLLDQQGYEQSSGALVGARVRHIKYNGSVIIPYIDEISYAIVDTDRRFLRLTNTCTRAVTHYDAQATEGFDPDHADSSDDDCDMQNCSHCEDEYDANSSGNSGYCTHCFSYYFRCAECRERIVDINGDRTYGIRGRLYCENCYDDLMLTCDNGPCENTWHEGIEFTANQTDDRVTRGVDGFCPSCAALSVCPCCGTASHWDEDWACGCDTPAALADETEVTCV